jgi:hypothetical protein
VDAPSERRRPVAQGSAHVRVVEPGWKSSFSIVALAKDDCSSRFQSGSVFGCWLSFITTYEAGGQVLERVGTERVRCA